MKLTGWKLVEGRIPGQHITHDPSMADVIAAIEAIHPDMSDPYVILDTPENAGRGNGYCQTVACDGAYRCEIRIYGRDWHEYTHHELTRPDEEGRLGIPDPDRPGWVSGYDPDLAAVTRVFATFASRPTELPQIDGWQWRDITEEVNAAS